MNERKYNECCRGMGKRVVQAIYMDMFVSCVMCGSYVSEDGSVNG